MKNRVRVLASILSIIVSAFTLTSLTFAWINTNQNVDRVTIMTGEGKFEVHAGLYRRHSESLLTSVDSAPNFAQTINEENSTNLAIAFDFAAQHEYITPNNFGLGELVHDEFILDMTKLPSYVYELHAHTLLDTSYVKVSVSRPAYTGSEPTPDFTLYDFRYLIVDNDVDNPFEYAAPVKLGELEGEERHDFNGATEVYLTKGADIYDAHEIVVPSGDQAVYEEYFAKSILILITPKPLEFMDFIKTNTNKGNDAKLIGMKMRIMIEFSLVPFGA